MPNGNSYAEWVSSRDFIQCSAFTYDPNGNTYGVAAGGESNDNQADCYSFFASKWGKPGNETFNGDKMLRIGSIADGTNGKDENNMAKDRYRSSSLVADGTNVYLAYFDLLTGQIRYKVGPTVPDAKGNFGNFVDAHDGGLGSYGVDDTPNVQIVATGSGEGLGYAGEYLGLAKTSKAIVLVWYDSKNGNLMMSYDTGLTEVLHDKLTKTKNGETEIYQAKNAQNQTVNTGWTEPKVLLEGAGRYCQVTVDANDGIHVAAFKSSTGDLQYVYIPSKTGNNKGLPDYDSKKVCTVDSYLSVGKEITIDVAMVGNNPVPYIGYWGTTPKKARLAYLADPETFYATTDAVRDGANIDDVYTGVWECAIVPTTSIAHSGDTVHRINVGVWKTTAGALTKSTTGTDAAADKNSGKCYGNGTSNAVLGYSIEVGAGGNIETAQRR